MNDIFNSKALRNARIPRQEFNPADASHRESLKNFLETGNWGKIQFFAEPPYLSVPETVLRKMAAKALADA